MFCHVAPEQVFGVHDVSSVYHVPLLLHSQGIISYLTKRLALEKIGITSTMKQCGQDLDRRWREMLNGSVLHLHCVLHLINLTVMLTFTRQLILSWSANTLI